MKTIKFTPKAVSGFTAEVEGKEEKVAPTFSGHIMLRVPDYFERQELKALMISLVSKDGETDMETLKGASRSKMNVGAVMSGMAKLVRASVPFYEAVELRSLSTGEELKSFEDLSIDREAEGILQEVAQELASGLSLSKN